MKHAICSLVFAFFSITGFAQEIGDSASIAMDTAAYHYGNTINTAKTNFQVKREPIVYRRAFRVNSATNEQEVYTRALGFARTVNVDFKEDKKHSTITIPVTWQYKGGFNECIEDLTLNARLVLETKGTKTRISLTDITYEHHAKDDATVKPVAKSDFFTKYPDCAPKQGKAELLYNCSECSRSMNSIDKNFQSQFETLAGEYQEWLKKY